MTTLRRSGQEHEEANTSWRGPYAAGDQVLRAVLRSRITYRLTFDLSRCRPVVQPAAGLNDCSNG